jgi:ABC-type uncharacterized transport system involved in gliding motility auxiliary subunit
MKPSPNISKWALLRWAEVVLLVALFSGVLILINVIAYENSTRFDLTPGKRYSLAPQSVQILNALTDDLTVTIFHKKGEGDTEKDLLELFSRADSRFRYHFLDLDKNPARAQALGIRDYGAGVAEYQGRKEKIRSLTEENLVNAMLRLTDRSEKTVRFVTGHGEKSLSGEDNKTSYSTLKNALELENYRAEELSLLQAKKIPEDTLILVVGGPQKDYLQKELALIADYLKQGGRVIFMFDPFPLPLLEQYCKTVGVDLPHDIIIDTESKLFELDDITPLIFPDKRHPITERANEGFVFPFCRPVIPLKEPPAGLAAGIFAFSGPRSWAERDTKSVYDGKYRFDRDTDTSGPVPVAVTVEIAGGPKPGSAPGKTTRLAVIGDSDFVTNNYINVLGNKDLFLNTINWLAERQHLVSIRPKAESTAVSMLFLTENENRLVLWSAVIIEPLLVLAVGFVVVLWRRRRR